jgi:hypothetical protein
MKLVLAMLAMAGSVAGQFGIQPILAGLKEEAGLPRSVMESAFRDRFATWHGVASGLYVLAEPAGDRRPSWVQRSAR